VYFQGPAVLPCSDPMTSPFLWHLTDAAEQSSKCDKASTCRTCVVDSVAKKAEDRFIIHRLLPILATTASICFDHDSLQSRVTPSSLVSSTCSFSTWFIIRFSWCLGFSECFVANTMLLVFRVLQCLDIPRGASPPTSGGFSTTSWASPSNSPPRSFVSPGQIWRVSIQMLWLPTPVIPLFY
jgi:hypothetical protein